MCDDAELLIVDSPQQSQVQGPMVGLSRASLSRVVLVVGGLLGALSSYSRNLSYPERILLRRTARMMVRALPPNSPIQYGALYQKMLKLAAAPQMAFDENSNEAPGIQLRDQVIKLGQDFGKEFVAAAIASNAPEKSGEVRAHLNKALSFFFRALMLAVTNGGLVSSDAHITAAAYMSLWIPTMLVTAFTSHPMALKVGSGIVTILGFGAYYANIYRRDFHRKAFLPIPFFTRFFGRRSVRNQLIADFAANASREVSPRWSGDGTDEALRAFIDRMKAKGRDISDWNAFPLKPQKNIEQTVSLFEELSPGIFQEALDRFVSCEDSF